MLLLITECIFTKKQFLVQRFSYNSSKNDYHLNIKIT